MKTFLRYLWWRNEAVNGLGNYCLAYLVWFRFYKRTWGKTPPAGDRHLGRWAHGTCRRGWWFYLPRSWVMHVVPLTVRARRGGRWFFRRRFNSTWHPEWR